MGFLSRNFTLEELCVTGTGLPNIPDAGHTEKMLYLATYILQPIRNKSNYEDVTSFSVNRKGNDVWDMLAVHLLIITAFTLQP